MRLRLIPREERFFDLFVEDAANVLAAARRLEEMLRVYDNVPKRAAELLEMEHQGDELSHAIGRKLNGTFVTPFDRDDIHELNSTLDDVLDLIEQVADTFVLYSVDEPTSAAVKQASIVVKQCEAIHEALSRLRTFDDGLQDYWITIHGLENDGDRITRKAVASLFAEKTKATDIIKWKDIYQLLEETMDHCDDVANILERIVVKHA